MVKLSRTQLAAILRLASFQCGWESRPAGYSTAGRDASAWKRTMSALEDKGLVVITHGNGCAQITDEGRKFVLGIPTVGEEKTQ